jgi:hypothetical protein
METAWIDQIPMPALFVLTLLAVLLSIGVGMYAAALAKGGGESIGSIVGAVLGLLAFILAFTFNMTANRFDERKHLLLQDVSAIGTTYLRAGLLPRPDAAEVRALLREYVALRAGQARREVATSDVLAGSERIQTEIWAKIEAVMATGPVTPAHTLLIQSVNQMFDTHDNRVAVALQFRIPGTIWFGLYAVTILAMVTVGYQLGQAAQRPYVVVAILALAFSSVILLIADLDRTVEGTVQVSQQPLFELERKIRAP